MRYYMGRVSKESNSIRKPLEIMKSNLDIFKFKTKPDLDSIIPIQQPYRLVLSHPAPIPLLAQGSGCGRLYSTHGGSGTKPNTTNTSYIVTMLDRLSNCESALLHVKYQVHKRVYTHGWICKLEV